MEKFTVFDILSILLPGVFLSYIIQLFLGYYEIETFEISKQLNYKLTDFGISLFFSILLGGLSFFTSNYLKNSYLYRNIFKIYKPIGKIMFSIEKPEDKFFLYLNNKSEEELEAKLFMPKAEYDKLEKAEQKKLIKLHDRFFALAYYDLQFFGKIDYPKTYQSFYFFFRNLITGILLLLPLVIWKIIEDYNIFIKEISILLGLSLISSIILARFFRSEMVKKLYITYNIFLKETFEEK